MNIKNNYFRFRFVTLVLIAILLVGLFLRLQGVFREDFAFTYDVGRDMLALHSVIVTHKFPLIGPTTGQQGIFYGPWWYYVLLIPFLISGGNPVGISLFMVVLGVLTIFFGYLAGKQINIFFGLLFALFISISQPLISSQIWNPYLSFPVISLMLFTTFSILKRKNEKKSAVWYFLITGLCFELLLDSEIFFGMLFDIGVLVYFVSVLRSKIRIKDILAFLFGFILLLVPRIIFDLRHQFLISKSFIHLLTYGLPQVKNEPLIARVNYLQNIFLSQWSYSVASGNMIAGSVILILVIAIFLFRYKYINSQLKKLFFLPIIILAIYFIYFMRNSTDIFSHFIIGLPIVYVFFLVFALVQLLMINKYIAAGILFILILINVSPLNLYANYAHPWQGDASVYKNKIEVMDYVYKNAKGQPFGYKIFTTDQYDQPYQYLFLWYGKNKYGYIPNSYSKLIYYIVEPDTQYHTRDKVWLQAHAKDGKILKEIKEKSGIIIQTRQI